MYANRNYGFWMTFNWSKKPFIYGLIYSCLVATVIFSAEHFFTTDISLPWQPLTVLGITVAFYLGFKNNSSYDRLWEARKIWGGIVNNSRSFGAALTSFVAGENKNDLIKEIIYRHIAWLITMTYQLRLSRKWEHTAERMGDAFPAQIGDDYYNMLEQKLKPYLNAEEFQTYRHKSNIATQLLATQSNRLQHLCDNNHIDNFRHMQFFELIKTFYDDQGKSERIKNFPFPRQYASVALWTTMIFAAMIPWGVVNIVNKENDFLFWISIPLSALLIWIFFLMEKIGDYSENPFEGTFNDIPVSAISRGIEIDLREMINDVDIPPPVVADVNGFLM